MYPYIFGHKITCQCKKTKRILNTTASFYDKKQGLREMRDVIVPCNCVISDYNKLASRIADRGKINVK